MTRHTQLTTQAFIALLLGMFMALFSEASSATPSAMPRDVRPAAASAALPKAGLNGCGYDFSLPAVTGCDGLLLSDPQFRTNPTDVFVATSTPNSLPAVRMKFGESFKLKDEGCLQLGKNGNDFSVSMWVKPSGTAQVLSSNITPFGGGGAGFLLGVSTEYGRANFVLSTSSTTGIGSGKRTFFESVPIELNTWMYVTLTYTTDGEKSVASITVNGVTTSGGVSAEPFGGPVQVGDRAAYKFFEPIELGDIRSYGRALSDAEIRAQWLAAAPFIGVTTAALGVAISQLSAHFNGTAPLDATGFAAAAAAMTKNASFLPTSESLMVAALDLADVYESSAGPLFVSAATLPGIREIAVVGETAAVREARTMLNIFQIVHDGVFRNETIAACSAVLQGRRWKTADYFPGKVTATVDPNKTFTVPVNATAPPTWGHPTAFAGSPKTRPTGLYLPPGAVARVTVPAALVNEGFAVQVGAHTVDHTTKENHTRMHRTTKRYAIAQPVTYVANPVGGGVYIEVPILATAGMVSVQVQGVVEAPMFSLRSFDTMTVADWTARRTAGAPWADFVTDYFMMQVPSNYVYAKADMTPIMKAWDTMMKAYSEFVGIPPSRRNDVVAWFQTDVQIAGGGGSIGYPQVNNDFNPRTIQNGNSGDRLVSAPMGCAGFDCHELGHAQLFSNFRGEGETMVNMPWAYIANTQFGYTFDEAFRLSFDSVGTGGHTPDRAAVDWMVTVNFGNGAEMDYSNTTKDEFRYQKRGVGKYADIGRLFGWKAITNFYDKENLDYNAGTPSDGLSAVDSRILRLSVQAGADLTPLIHFWGIRPVEPARLKAAIAAKGIGSSLAIKELILRYRTLIPANNAAFDVFFESVFPGMPAGYSPDFGPGWYQVRRTQWNESLAVKAAGTIDALVALYYPNTNAQTLNIDGSAGSVYEPASDGVLLMRYLLGLRGAALINNARSIRTGVSTSAGLRDAAQIEAHIAANLARFDVDGDGKTLALTDGVMILRRLLNPGAATTDAAAMANITTRAKIGARSDIDVVNAIDALRP